jgi:hypothetical protein
MHSPLFTALWHHALYLAIAGYLVGVAVLAFQRASVSWKYIFKWPKFFFDIEKFEKFMAQGTPASWQQADDARKELEKTGIWNREYGPILLDRNEAGSYYVLVKVLGPPSAGLLAAAKAMPKVVKDVEVVLKPSQL